MLCASNEEPTTSRSSKVARDHRKSGWMPERRAVSFIHSVEGEASARDQAGRLRNWDSFRSSRQSKLLQDPERGLDWTPFESIFLWTEQGRRGIQDSR